MLKPIKSLNDLQLVISKGVDVKQKIQSKPDLPYYFEDISHVKFMFWNLYEVVKQIQLENLFVEEPKIQK